MSSLDLERLRQGNPGCPSDVTLHRLRAGELGGEQARALQQHVDGCEPCTARMTENAAGFAAWNEGDPVRMLAAIRRGADQRSSGGWWRSLTRFALAPLALAASAVAIFVALPERGAPSTTRMKGGAILHVFRLQAGVAVEAISGDRFAPGEPLQLTVDVPKDSLVQIAGVEADGDLYPIWPREGRSAFVPMKAGAGQRLPGAVTLDDVPGSETFHVIACPPQPSSPPSCRSRGASEPPDCPPGCTSTPFVVRKER